MADLLMLKIVVGGMARYKCSADKVLAAVHSLLASNLITFPTLTTLASPIPTSCMDPESTSEQIEDDVVSLRDNRFTGIIIQCHFFFLPNFRVSFKRRLQPK